MNNARLGPIRPLRERTAWLPALAAALVFFTFGFGVLLILWLGGDWPANVPGFFDYRSATFGDGLLLPVLVACLVAALLNLSGYRATNERAWMVSSGIAGAFSGAALQATWLLDDDPQRNWSFPEAHHFNVAGWYHAVFVAAALGLIVALVVMLLRRLRVMPAEGNGAAAVLDSSWTAIGLAAAVAFGGLVVRDAKVGSAGDLSVVATLVFTAVLTVIALALALSLGRVRLRALSSAVPVALVLATGVVIAVDEPPEANTSLALWAAVACVSLAVGMCERLRQSRQPQRRGRWLAALAGTVVLLYASWSFALRGDEFPNAHAVGLLLGPLLAFGLVQLLGGEESRVERFQMLVAVLAPLAALGLAEGVSNWPELTDGPYTGVLAGVSLVPFALVTRRFSELVKAEEAHRDGEMTLSQMEAITLSLWWEMSGLALAGFIAFVKCATAFVDLQDTTPVGRDTPSLAPTLIAGVIATVIAGSTWWRARPEPTGELRLSPSRRLCFAIGVAAGIWLLAPLASLPWHLGFAAGAAVGGAGFGMLVFDELDANVARVHRVGLGLLPRVLLAVLALAVAVNVAWVVAEAAWANGKPAPAEFVGDATLLVLFVAIGLTTFAGSALAKTNSWGRLTIEPTPSNFRQDFMLYGILALAAVFTPLLIAQRADDPGPLLIFLGLLAALGATGGVYQAVRQGFWWVLQNNLHYLRTERERPPIGLLTKAVDLRRTAGGPTLDALKAERIRGITIHMKWQHVTACALLAGGWTSALSYLLIRQEEVEIGIASAVAVTAVFLGLIGRALPTKSDDELEPDRREVTDAS